MDLKSIITDNFEQCSRPSKHLLDDNIREDRNSYMEIPLDKDTIEIPVFALGDLVHYRSSFLARNDYQTMVAPLYNAGYPCSYKSLDANLRESLNSDYNIRHLTKVVSNNQAYYVSRGLILNSSFRVLMMQSWNLKQFTPEHSTYTGNHYTFTRSLLRVSPLVFTDKTNAVYKYIINKIIPIAATVNVFKPSTYAGGSIWTGSDNYLNRTKVEIDDSPFKIVDTELPSISTTNEELLKVALDHIDDIVP